MAAGYLDIEVQRNEVYAAVLEFADNTGVAIDLTGMTFSLVIRDAAGPATWRGAGSIVAVDLAAGQIEVRIDGRTIAAAIGAFETVRLAYDLLGVDVDTRPFVHVRGALILTPGVS